MFGSAETIRMARANAQSWCPGASKGFLLFVDRVQKNIDAINGAILPGLVVLEVAYLAESRFKVFAKVQFQANFEIADYLPDQVNRNNYGDQAVERVMRQLVSRPVFLSIDGRKVDLNVFAAMFLGVRCALNSSSDKYVKIIADLKKRGLDIQTYYTHIIEFLIG